MKSIVLTRVDLNRKSKDFKIEDINIYSFLPNRLSRRDILESSSINFIDEDGSSKVLKNRYS